MKTILKARNVVKSFDKGKLDRLEILKGISIDINRNEITVIIGASGTGKSTLLHILGGLDIPDSGTVEIEEVNLNKLNDEELSKFRNGKMGFVFQFHHLLPEFSALENVNIPQLIKGINQKEAAKRSKELLALVGLSERLDHKPSELSGGEQQRVAVARALANNPSIIFADEPSGNLDSQNSDILHKLFIDLKEKFGLTLLIVTHNPGLVSLADNVLEMKDGMIFNKKVS